MEHDSAPRTQHGASLEQRLRDAVARDGEAVVAGRARSLLEGGYEGEDFLRTVGGPHAEGILGGAPALYWPELWGARAFNYVWVDDMAPAVIAGLNNRAWRVREMCAKVCALRGVGTQSDLAPLLTDGHPRVRAGAARALAAVGDASSEEALEAMVRDVDKEVRRAAQQSLQQLQARLS